MEMAEAFFFLKANFWRGARAERVAWSFSDSALMACKLLERDERRIKGVAGDGLGYTFVGRGLVGSWLRLSLRWLGARFLLGSALLRLLARHPRSPCLAGFAFGLGELRTHGEYAARLGQARAIPTGKFMLKQPKEPLLRGLAKRVGGGSRRSHHFAASVPRTRALFQSS